MVEYVCGWCMCVDGGVCVMVCVDGVCKGRGWRELEGA